MRNILTFACIIATAAAMTTVPGSSTRKGTRTPAKGPSIYPQLSGASVSPVRSVAKVPGSFGRMSVAPLARGQAQGFGRRPARGRVGAMQRLLPLLMRGEGEGTVVILLAMLVDGTNDSDQLKFLMLSGRLGEEAQSFGRCLYIMRMPKMNCVYYTLMMNQ